MGSYHHGRGKLLLGGIYEGDFKNGMKHGKGTMSSSDGLIDYEGDFHENTITGAGTIYETGGKKYVGEVKMGIREGYAQVYDQDGDLMCEGLYIGNHPAMDSISQDALAVYLYTEQGKKEKAEKKIEELLEAIEDNAAAYKYLGSMYIELNKPSEAVEALNTGLPSAPDDAEFYALFALAYTLLGDDEKALDSLDKAESMGYPHIDELREFMTDLESEYSNETEF